MREHYRHRHGQLEQGCSSAVFLVAVRIAGVFLAVAPQGCGSPVMMYTRAGQGGFCWVSLCVLVTLHEGLVGMTRGSGGAGRLGRCDGCWRGFGYSSPSVGWAKLRGLGVVVPG